MRVIFSRDRPAQLDLLLRSIDRNMEPGATRVLSYASTEGFREGYDLIDVEYDDREFGVALRDALAATETVTFFCDDDIVYRPVPGPPQGMLLVGQIFSFCLYLGKGNVKQPIPDGFPLWEWAPLPRHDFGFPCAVDGNTYRAKDVLRLIGSDAIPNPTMLETVMLMRCQILQQQRPLMASFVDQCLVGVPVNRVGEQSGVPFGRRFPQDTVMLNDRFLAGERIDLDALDFTGIDSCHHEIQFVWR